MTSLAMPALPTSEEQEEALNAFELLQNVFGNRSGKLKRITVQAEGLEKSVTVPRPAFDVLMQILRQMSEGNAVTIVPFHAELTTQQAADFLNVSRPFVVGLIESKSLPAHKVGNRRRIRFQDLLNYKAVDDRERDLAALQLSEEAQNLGIEY